MRKGIAASTLKSYDFAWKIFAMFCASLHLPLKPVTISAVCAFICHCMDVRQFKPQYVRGLVAGIQFNARCSDPSFPSLFSNPSIKLLLRGISKVSPSSLDNKRPITLSILHKMLCVLRQGYFSPYVDSLLDCSFLLAFYGFLRSGEFTTSSNSFDPTRDVSFSDLTFHPDFFSLFLKHSKAGGACSVVIARIDSQYCPYKSMCKFLKKRPFSDPCAPLFLTPDSNPMSKSWFSYHLKQVLLRCNISPKHYSGHSFRIGAATSAAMQGLPSASLQQLGRWSSSAYASYVRPDASSIISAQRSLKP